MNTKKLNTITVLNRMGRRVTWPQYKDDDTINALPDGYTYELDAPHAHGPIEPTETFPVRTESGMVVQWSSAEPLRPGCVDLAEEQLASPSAN